MHQLDVQIESQPQIWDPDDDAMYNKYDNSDSEADKLPTYETEAM